MTTTDTDTAIRVLETNVIARQGVWTPWAAILCVACEQVVLDDRPAHYGKRRAYLATLDVAAHVAPSEGELLARCDTCRCACYVEAEVALLQRIGFAASELAWEHGTFGVAMAQTGGMCAALVLTDRAKGLQVVITGLDGSIVVGRYAVANPDEATWDEPIDVAETAPYYEGGALADADTLTVLVSEAARIAVQFSEVAL
jgi:hypothetical protein